MSVVQRCPLQVSLSSELSRHGFWVFTVLKKTHPLTSGLCEPEVRGQGAGKEGPLRATQEGERGLDI